jgi:hypothetical protein
VAQSFAPPQIPRAVWRTVNSKTDKGQGGIRMKSPSSNRIYLWSIRLGAILLIAMAIVAAWNAQQSSAGEKGWVKGQIIQEGL